MKKIFLIILLSISLCSNAFSWSGYEWERSEFIEIESGTLVRSGELIYVYHYGDEGYALETVLYVSSDEVITEDERGNWRTYDMDDY